MNDQALIVFTRIPEAGKMKTRLTPFLTEEECEGLQMAFLRDWDAKLQGVEADVYIAYTGGGAREEEFMNLFSGAEFIPQDEQGRMDRMCQAMEFVFGKGYQHCVLIGTNVPCGTRADIEQAFLVLREKDYVLGPTENGDYWLIGANAEDKMLRSLFLPDVSGEETVLAGTIGMIPRWKSYELLEERYDVDTIADLLLYRDAAEGAAAEYLKEHHVISVIAVIPGDEERQSVLLENLKKLVHRAEVILVSDPAEDASMDAGVNTNMDTDTVSHATTTSNGNSSSGNRMNGTSGRDRLAPKGAEGSAHLVRQVQSGGSRGVQLNAGAEAANGDVLFFLPAEAILPENPIAEMMSLIQSHDVGCFGTESKTAGLLRWKERRDIDRQLVQGTILESWGIVIRRDIFLDTGMFPEDANSGNMELALHLQNLETSIGRTANSLYRNR